LKLKGYDVRTALNAQTGIVEAEPGHPDAIIVDFRMPLVDGLEFVPSMRSRQERRSTPVPIVTGDYFLDETIASKLATLGARVEFKPLLTEDLISLARNLLEVIN
jgi:DNA-binding response OmpR family regulator